MMRVSLSICLVICAIFACPKTETAYGLQTSEPAVVSDQSLKDWLARPVAKRGPINKQAFATTPLKKSDVKPITQSIWESYVTQTKPEREQEWKAKQLQIDKLKMKFEVRVLGDKPKSGRSLFISMHGGGGAPAKVNDQQWRNQIRLYSPDEGVYIAPRAPTDTWNLWHQSHIDLFFQRLIQNAILFEDVDPNRVYLMGYSAGGDGVYQLAPRMADHFSAVAMMAGHPNGVSPLGLRNIGFTLHMGGKDSAYNRNKIAREWKTKLAKLKKGDADGYEHEVVIHEEMGHWMKREDAVAVPWMSKFNRNPYPGKVVWRQSGRLYSNFYWLSVDDKNRVPNSTLVVSRKGQVFNIEEADKVKRLTIRLNDQMVDMNQEVIVKQGDRVLFSAVCQRTTGSIYESIMKRGETGMVFSGAITVDITPDPENSDSKE